ncbi:hypothetical protein GUJ93_ZPchr0001g30359 [Zizania palustris]|uniref:Uncharacterized protein n=1 Tax=Zizania palustris TaxID=103762 RepID=A0A8J5RLQ0_ZIZPA|nr:hypothetical protein GUJ93_ZPchr0001g30359 [Zizania palustris]
MECQTKATSNVSGDASFLPSPLLLRRRRRPLPISLHLQEDGNFGPRRRLRCENRTPTDTPRWPRPRLAASVTGGVVVPCPSRPYPPQVGGGSVRWAGDSDALSQRGGGDAAEVLHRRRLLLLELVVPRFKKAHLIMARSCAAVRICFAFVTESCT